MLEWLHKSLQLKQGFVKPDVYLGAKFPKTRLHNEVWAWVMSPVVAFGNCIVCLAFKYGGRFRLPKKAENPFKMGYDLELDTSPE